ncbi:MAG TPA: LysR family transcriptional regulator [Acidimicrobiales bacterium]|nr:LysR family transcriptional regulator [Acidimicrobiales bacterium]
MPLTEPVPDLRSLDLLHSVAETGSIRQAALLHQMSQPAASMRLRTLEKTLGLQLLDRSHGRAQLTSSGAAVVQWSAEVLAPMRELLLGARALNADSATRLRVVASLTVAEYLVPGWLARLRHSDPTLMISLQMGNSTHVTEVVLSGDADVGFVEGRHAPSELASRVMLTDDLVVVVAPTSPLARRKKALTARELSSVPLALREAGSGTREVLEVAMRSLDLSVTPLVQLGSTTAIKAAVASGVGAGVLSRLAVESDVLEGRLVVVKIDGLSLERSIRLVWARGTSLTPAAKRLVRVVESARPPS